MQPSHYPERVLKRLRGAADNRWQDSQHLDAGEVSRYRVLNGYPCIEESPAVVPPGFAAVLTFRAVLRVLHDPTLDLPFGRNLHASQSLTWQYPLTADTQVHTTSRVTNVVSRPSALFFDVCTETRDHRGYLCCAGTSTQALRHV
ncbi:hypothetical protein FHT40_006776 [Mycolicibacterium sp. BK556]|uniref:FAS1-like dehydratase domain-containing protein n=1 Tax=unclassified Mycolicibacterium TaxID=2636767 RepID=UPI001048219E|nr:hypothetical protein [Mycolicibacterium sp. BK556]MBB3636814.1 hypothetical protein [Mycolicibacterium sp. BK607]